MTAPVDLTGSPLVDAREQLAAAITDAGWTCHPRFTARIATPAVILSGNGWKVTTSGLVTYLVQVTCLYGGSASPTDAVEELARQVVVACVDAGWGVFEVPAPAGYTFGEADTGRTYAGVQFDAHRPVTLRSI